MVYRPMAKEKTMKSPHDGINQSWVKINLFRLSLEDTGQARSAAVAGQIYKKWAALIFRYAGSRRIRPIRSC